MPNPVGHPLQRLGEDDLSMICRFVLASGSIKDLAAAYGVSYPTMRSRLDRLIARLRAVMENQPADPLKEYLADLIARGHLPSTIARRIRVMHETAIDQVRGIPNHAEHNP